MSQKDEIDKPRGETPDELSRERQEFADALERRCAKFAPLRAILEEIVAAVGPSYVEAELDPHSHFATIRLKGKSVAASEWRRISPNMEVNRETWTYEDAPGFMIEDSYVDDPDYVKETFADEQLVAKWIVDWITAHIAEEQS